MIGTTLAHFKITGKLGEGGMGEVYRAEDSKLGREVAIKVLPEMVAGDAERMARFEREAKLLASLNHPNIGAIYSIEHAERSAATEVFQDPKTPGPQDQEPPSPQAPTPSSPPIHFLVLELIEGETLSELLDRGPIGLEKSLEIAQQIAVALEAAHASGVIHRDLKPANVKLTPGGQVKVLDFGLAKAWDVEETSGSSPLISRSPTLTQGMTEAGMLLGTAAYMSPEQARGKPVDKRADIWAYGAVLLEMLTGRKAFGGETVTDMIAAVVAREPEWERLPADTPRAVNRLLRRCLEKDQEKRLRDIGDARLELEELLAHPEGLHAEPATVAAPGKASLLWKVAAVVLALMAAGLGFGLWRASQPEPVQITRAYIPAPSDGEFDLGTDYPAPVAVSPDGRSLVFGVQEAGNKRLWVRDLDDLEARPLAGTEGALYPFWSPDSRFIGFFAQGKLKKIEVSGGPAMSLCGAPNGKGGTWNDEGVIVFAPSHTTSLQRVSAAGGEPVNVTQVDPEAGEDSHRHPRFLPDGEHFLYAARVGFGGGSENSRLMLGSLSGEARELMPGSSNVEYAAGHLLYVYERTLMARPFDAEGLELAGDAFPIAEEIWGDQGALLGVFSVSDGGVLAYQTGTPREDVDAQLQWIDRSGNLLGEVGTPGPYSEVSISPDGSTAVVNIRDPESANRDLWLVDLERQLKTRFTFDAAQDWIAVWSPDGTRIAFSSERSGTGDLYIKSVIGGGEAELLYDDDTQKYPASWSSDGRYLFYESWGTDGGSNLFALDLEQEGEPIAIQVADFTQRVPVISPNGRWLAYVSDESGHDEIYVTAFPGGGRKWQVSTEQTSFARWASDQEVLMMGPTGELKVAEVDGSGETFRVGPIRDIADLQVQTLGFSVSPAPEAEKILVASLLEAEGQSSSMDPMTLVLGWTADLERP
jgi:Tol biopolymer transport system component